MKEVPNKTTQATAVRAFLFSLSQVPGAAYDRFIRAFMKHCTLLIIAALLGSLIVGCSKQPGSSASFVINPGVSIGPVHSGMTIQEVVKQLGEPNQTSDSVLKYLNLGFEVIPSKEGLVQSVMCVIKAGPFTKAFAGHTNEGIGIGSSRADVIKAYGEPTATGSIDGQSGSGVLKYEPLGFVFGLRGGKVFRIFTGVPLRHRS